MQASWRGGCGVITHSDETQQRLQDILLSAERGKLALTQAELSGVFSATDRLANAAMWLVAHMAYARRVDLSGAPLEAEDFKPAPEGHMGGSLNMAPSPAILRPMHSVDTHAPGPWAKVTASLPSKRSTR